MPFSNLLDTIFRPSNRGAQNAPKTRKLRLESLESRQLLATVTTHLDVVDPDDGVMSLREAIAETPANGVITFDFNLIDNKTIVLNETLTINKSLTIDGWNLPATPNMPVGTDKGITIDGSGIQYASQANAPMLRVVNPVSGEFASNINVTVRGLTFTNTKSVAEMDVAIGDEAADGIAILVANDYEGTTKVNLTVQNCVFTDLKYGARGPIAFYGRHLTVANTLIADNYACTNCLRAAGVHFNGTMLTMNNCTVANNDLYHTPDSGGYGLINYADSNHNEIKVYNSIFVDNNGGDFLAASGGKIHVFSSLVEDSASSSVIFDNTTPFTGLYSDLFFDKASGNYTLAEESPAINLGDPLYDFGYILIPENNDQGYDLAGNYRLKDGAVDAGAYTGGIAPWVLVTISEDEYDHTNDFFADGTPNRISLREAYDYIERYYRGGNFNDFAGSFAVDDGTAADPYSSIQFAAGITSCVLNSEIVSEKTYTIQGENRGGVNVTVHGSETKTNPGTFSATNINASDAVRIFNVQSGKITAYNLSFANALARVDRNDTTSPEYGKGGAIYVAGGAGYFANGGKFSYNYAEAAGGAVHVEAGGYFRGTRVTFNNNQSSRGGAISNFGTVALTGTNSLSQNTASATAFAGIPGFDTTKTRGFGGAIYNAGKLDIGAQNQSNWTTFTANSALSTADPGAQLLGGSGGAIYNTTLNGTPAYATLYYVKFNNNTSSKYGGAISNFGVLNSCQPVFAGNTSSSGGALQNSGTAALTSSSFNLNVAARNANPLAANGKDFGGNGGAIFTGGADASLTLDIDSVFSGNTAANAGGAIDYINGSLTFTGVNHTIEGNEAGVIGGAIVAAKPITFVGTPVFGFGVGGAAANTAGLYAPNVAVASSVSEEAVAEMAENFFPDFLNPDGTVDATLIDTFRRGGVLAAGNKLTFESLAETFATPPAEISVKVDDGAYTPLTAGGYVELAPREQPYVVFYYSSADPNVIFRTSVQVTDATTSVSFAQIDLSGRGYLGVGDYAVGIAIRVNAANPIVEWTLDWGDPAHTTTTSDAFGFTYNAYNVYDAPGTYYLTLTTRDSAGVTKTYTNAAYCVVKDPEPASGAQLDAQEELFADEKLLDELFVEF